MSETGSETVIPRPKPVDLPVAGSDAVFPVRRVYCVARNYADHAREMGADPSREPPFFFSKPADAILPPGQEPHYPPETRDLHHEVELVVALKDGGQHLSVLDASACIFGYAVGVDLTRRCAQMEAKHAGRPWDLAKGFDGSGPCSAVHPVDHVGHPGEGSIRLSVNNEERQSGDLREMIWIVPEIIASLSRQVRLAPGDLIFTGTPAGVSALEPGDKVEATVSGVDRLVFFVR